MKAVKLAVITVLAFLLMGCETEQHYKMQETVKSNYLETKVISVDFASGITNDNGIVIAKAQEGNVLMVVYSTVKNVNTEPERVRMGRLMFRDVSGKEYWFDKPETIIDKDFMPRSVNPLSTEDFFSVFSVPSAMSQGAWFFCPSGKGKECLVDLIEGVK